MSEPAEWEQLDADEYPFLSRETWSTDRFIHLPTIERLVVPGGWLYRTSKWGAPEARSEDGARGRGYAVVLLAQQVTYVPAPCRRKRSAKVQP